MVDFVFHALQAGAVADLLFHIQEIHGQPEALEDPSTKHVVYIMGTLDYLYFIEPRLTRRNRSK